MASYRSFGGGAVSEYCRAAKLTVLFCFSVPHSSSCSSTARGKACPIRRLAYLQAATFYLAFRFLFGHHPSLVWSPFTAVPCHHRIGSSSVKVVVRACWR